MTSQYIEFREIARKSRTVVYGVFSKRHGDKLGEIKWFGRWRQYVFFPTNETIWNLNCLVDVIIFLRKLREARGERVEVENCVSEVTAIPNRTPDNGAAESTVSTLPKFVMEELECPK